MTIPRAALVPTIAEASLPGVERKRIVIEDAMAHLAPSEIAPILARALRKAFHSREQAHACAQLIERLTDA